VIARIRKPRSALSRIASYRAIGQSTRLISGPCHTWEFACLSTAGLGQPPWTVLRLCQVTANHTVCVDNHFAVRHTKTTHRRILSSNASRRLARNYPLFAHITSYSSPGRALDCAISCSPGDLFHSIRSRHEQSPDHDDFSLRPRIISSSKPRADISGIFWLGCRSPLTLQCLPISTIAVCNTPAAGIIFY
jgi:hypothetical protein